jgi:glycyl-tRNA synthetase beta chain
VRYWWDTTIFRLKNLYVFLKLLDDVTALTEYPSVYEGEFDSTFLEVPRECLIISMQQHQKYFPLDNKQGRLLPKFLFVSNMKTATPKDIIHGNERVLRARLSDARFFFDQDRKTKLETRVPRLAHVVYHNKLGSQLERVQRIQKLAGEIARQIHAGYVAAAERAAYLCKADLVTDMVGEFPELQGTMGYYYALHDGEDLHVADAIRQHYRPRYAGDALPLSATDISVALADKLDTLVGIYGIGLVPTGDKDPFGLRRLALGVVRILVERTETLTQKNREQHDQPLHVRMREELVPMLQPLDVLKLLQLAHSQFPNGVVADSVAEDLHAFMLERLKPYLRDKGFESDEIDAVLSLNLPYLDKVVPRLHALQAFRVLPEAKTLAAANKRIGNILRQAGGNPADYEKSNPELFEHFAEKALGEAVLSLHNEVIQTFGAGDYTDGLKRLARLGPYVDRFFDEVMVMADDIPVRNNRLALLNELRDLFLWVADISKLQS